MKAIQITIDGELLSRLDACPEVKQEGRSAVLRRAVTEYLQRKREQAIRERYRNAYPEGAGLGQEYQGWEEQGQWPEE